MSALLPQALDINAYTFSNGLTDEALLKVFLFERAFLYNHTTAAQRLACLADFAPMPDKPVMRVTPLFTRNNFFQLLFRSQRVLALRQPQTVRHTKNMRIYCQRRNIIDNAGDNVCRFCPTPGNSINVLMSSGITLLKRCVSIWHIPSRFLALA